MSEKRSWDIRPNPKKAARKPDTLVITRATKPRAGIVSGRNQLSLRTRRRSIRKRLLILLGVLLVIAVGAGIYGIWRPEVRVQHVEATGSDAAQLPQIAQNAITGTYWYIVPRDSIFFVPEQTIRSAILSTYPDIVAVSIKRTGFDSLSVQALPRIAAFAWCGGSLASTTDSCYEADAEGLVFAHIVPVAPTNASSSSPTLVPPGTLMIYGPLVESATSTSPIWSHVADASAIPDILRFVRAVQSLGADVVSLQLRGDEADLFLASGTRITYLVGHEQAAADLAATAFPQLNLNDGSIEYVDLRFDGKVYYKKKGA